MCPGTWVLFKNYSCNKLRGPTFEHAGNNQSNHAPYHALVLEDCTEFSMSSYPTDTKFSTAVCTHEKIPEHTAPGAGTRPRPGYIQLFLSCVCMYLNPAFSGTVLWAT